MLAAVRSLDGRDALAADAAHGKGSKARAAGWLEIPQGFEETDASFLEQVVALLSVDVECAAGSEDQTLEVEDQLRAERAVTCSLIYGNCFCDTVFCHLRSEPLYLNAIIS